MADSNLLPGSPSVPRATGYTNRGFIANGNTSSFDQGNAITTNTNGEILFAKADAAGTANVLGLVIEAAEGSGRPVGYQIDGLMTLEIAQWDNVTGQTGGLTPQAVYWLSPATAGKLTTTKPISGGAYQTPIGYATSSKTMRLLFGVAQGPFS